MILWFPSHIPKETVFIYLRQFDKTTFTQILQDKIHSRYPSFSQTKVVVNNNFEEIDIQCSICLEQGDYQLACGHVFHKKCIVRWKKTNRTCPMCRASI